MDGMTAKRNGWAKASLILGLLQLVTCIVATLPAIVCGHIALRQIKKAAGAQAGRDMALAGTLLGYVGLMTFLFAANVLHGVNIKGSIEGTGGRGHRILVFIHLDGYKKSNGPLWPSVGTHPERQEFSSSTAYFQSLVERKILTNDFSIFTAVHVSFFGEDPKAALLPEENAWCVVADVREDNPDGLPFLISRNVQVSSLSELKGRVRDRLSDEEPFGRQWAVIITKDGNVVHCPAEARWEELLRGSYTNRVLRP